MKDSDPPSDQKEVVIPIIRADLIARNGLAFREFGRCSLAMSAGTARAERSFMFLMMNEGAGEVMVGMNDLPWLYIYFQVLGMRGAGGIRLGFRQWCSLYGRGVPRGFARELRLFGILGHIRT